MEALTRLKEFLRGLPARWQEGLRGEGGFNIMDVTAAVAITATLAAVVTPSVKGSMDNARVSSLMQEVTNIRNSLLKFNSDTNRMPVILGSSGAEDINGNNPVVAVTTTDPGTGLVTVVTPAAAGTSGLRVNQLPIVTWQGAYMDKDVGKNPFGGEYSLLYATLGFHSNLNVSDLLPPIISGGAVTTAADRDSVAFLVDALPPEVIAKVDSSLDDGNPTKGIIRDVSGTSSTGSAVKMMAVVVLPGVNINAGLGTPQ